MGWWEAGDGGIPTLLRVQWWVQTRALAQRPCSGSVRPHRGAGALVPVTPPPLPAVIPAVKLQYVDNIRWIREAAKHQLVRLQLGGRGAVWTLPQVRCCALSRQLGEAPPATAPRGTVQRSLSEGGLDSGSRGNDLGQGIHLGDSSFTKCYLPRIPCNLC